MTKNKKTALIISSSALVLLLAFFLFFYLNWQLNYKDKLPNGTFVGSLDLSGKKQNEALEIIKNRQQELIDKGIEFKSGDKSIFFPLRVTQISPDIPGADFKYAESVVLNSEETVFNLFSSQKNNFFKYILSWFNSKLKYEYPLKFTYSPQILEEWLLINFPELNIKSESAYFSLNIINNEINLINNQEKIGKEINFEELNSDFQNNLSKLLIEPIFITTKSTYPIIKQVDLEVVRPSAEKIIDLNNFLVYFFEEVNKKPEKIVFKISLNEIITWFSANKKSGQLEVAFDEEKIKNYLTTNIAPRIDKEVILPRFEMNNGKVTNWQGGKNGRALNLDESALLIAENLKTYSSEAELKINELLVDDFNLDNNFKITELLGTGHSNFAGSPVNRRHNITVGAEAVHGVLIKPGEEFSLVSALGDISAETGYLPELVIKGDKTIPEYGGGLCQIATTIFRSALNTGLPITARRNHSYRVSYYEPAGTDAAVYDPWPDVKFINDTANYVLIQSRIEKNDIYIDFWGTSDGRVATTTDPIIYNIVKPPATKFIESEDLKPGEKKCTESAHNGADAYFDYLVIYPEGATTTPRQEVRFSSHYVPWQEVCLIGKEEIKENTEEENLENTNQELNPLITPETENKINSEELN